MTDPRLHVLARQVANRIARGRDPMTVVLAALIAATGREALAPIYDALPRRSRAVCWALWGEPPLRAVDVHRFIGGSYHSVHELLARLVRHHLVVRVGYGRYTLPESADVPTTAPVLTSKTEAA